MDLYANFSTANVILNETKKPLSFSLCPLNIAYVKEQVAIQKKTNSRYGVSQWGDDLITHLRTKAKPKKKPVELVVNDKKPVKRFIPPTVVQIHLYMTSIGFDGISEANKFSDFYESNGWKVGKNKMKCWKAAVRNWLKNSNGKQFTAQGKTSGNLSACEDFING